MLNLGRQNKKLRNVKKTDPTQPEDAPLIDITEMGFVPDVEPDLKKVRGKLQSYKYRDPDKRRAYMRDKMRERRAEKAKANE